MKCFKKGCKKNAEYRWAVTNCGTDKTRVQACRAHTPREHRNPFTILSTRYTVKSVV